jgi:hypothetical protein
MISRLRLARCFWTRMPATPDRREEEEEEGVVVEEDGGGGVV